MSQDSSKDLFKKYPHLDSLSKVKDIFLEPEVICTEKIHGTNARVGWINGKVRIGGRNIEHTNDGDNSIMGFTGWIRSKEFENSWPELLGDQNIIFYGEWFGPGIQKGIKYGDEKQFRVFDVRVNGVLADWSTVVHLASGAGFDVVPVLYKGAPSLEKFDEILQIQSEVGKANGITEEENLHEGIVIKPTVMKRNYDGWLIAKYKHARWTERKSEKTKKDYKPLPGEVHAFVEEFVTEVRFHHVLDTLRDDGIVINDMSVAPHLLKGMNEDVEREGRDELKEILNDEVSWKHITKLISKKTITFLREYLHKKMKDASDLNFDH